MDIPWAACWTRIIYIGTPILHVPFRHSFVPSRPFGTAISAIIVSAMCVATERWIFCCYSFECWINFHCIVQCDGNLAHLINRTWWSFSFFLLMLSMAVQITGSIAPVHRFKVEKTNAPGDWRLLGERKSEEERGLSQKREKHYLLWT